ncbi:MAG: sensor histidine kinase [Armatimonadota bacterium]
MVPVQTEELLRQVLEQLNDVICLLQMPEGTIAYVSPQVSCWGLTPDEVIGRHMGDFIHPDDWPMVQANLEETLAGSREFPSCFRVITPRGDVLHIEENGKVIRENGRIAGIASVLRNVTGRKLAEQALQASERRFRALVEHSADAMALLAPDGTFLYASPAASRINGFSMEDFLGQNALEIIHPDDLPHVQEQLARIACEPDAVMQVRFRIRHRDGNWRWLDANAQNMLGDPDIGAIVVNYRDITAAVQADEARQRSERKFTNLFHFTPIPAAINCAETHRYLDVNIAFERDTGYRREEVIGRSPIELGILDADTRNLAMAIMRDRQHYIGFEAPFRIKSGEVRTGLFALEKANLDGRPVLLTAVIDITERRQALSELQQAHDELEMRVEERTAEMMRGRAYEKAMIELLPLPLYFLTNERKISWANPAAQRLEKQFNLTDRNQLRLLEPGMRAPVASHRWPSERALAGEVVATEEYLFTATETEEEIPCLISATPVWIEGHIVAAAVLIEDITALREADRAKDEFLSVLSHELQTPLTAILGWSGFALQQDAPEYFRQAMQVVYRNAYRQKTLISDMLDISRLIHRKFSIVTEPLDLTEQARQAVENMRPQAEERQITLASEMPAAPLPVHADPARLQQCLANLLQNGLKFTPAGGSVTMSCRREGNDALLSISDTGRGIEPEKLPEIFHPFRQVDRDDSIGGLGLGLSVVHGIIELHGGYVSANSAGLGLGSTFTISLPISTDES